jgi:nanoRNase/pAp phosphatase (c-di-AMP/oligoRNAs hydrolase)
VVTIGEGLSRENKLPALASPDNCSPFTPEALQPDYNNRDDAVSYESNFIDSVEEAENVAFVLHDDPDPDALGSGFAGYKIAEKYGADAEIFHAEGMSHELNEDLADTIGIPDTSYQQADESIENYDEVYLIDTNGGNLHAFEDIEENLFSSITGIIDHHQDNSEKNEYPSLSEENKWIEEEDAGSTASLMTEILKEDNYFESEQVRDEDKKKVATALMRGIETDTYNLQDGTKKDHNHHGFLENQYNLHSNGTNDIYEELLYQEKQSKKDLNYKRELGTSIEDPGSPIDHLKLVEMDSNQKSDIWMAANEEIRKADRNTLIMAYNAAENGNGSGVKMSARAYLEDEETSENFDIEEFLTESPILNQAKKNNSMGGKQIRRVHEAGGWMPDTNTDQFTAGMVDLISSYNSRNNQKTNKKTGRRKTRNLESTRNKASGRLNKKRVHLKPSTYPITSPHTSRTFNAPKRFRSRRNPSPRSRRIISPSRSFNPVEPGSMRESKVFI